MGWERHSAHTGRRLAVGRLIWGEEIAGSIPAGPTKGRAMRLTLRRSDWIDDWYVIERASVDGSSGRICGADVEGTAEEMLKIADAIELRTRTTYGRCAVDATKDPVEFWSPRNSVTPGRVTRAEAEELAKVIREVVGTATATEAE